MGSKGSAVLAGTLLLAGCQYDFPVRATYVDGRYVLTAPYTAGRAAPHTCVRTLRIVEGEETVWAIENSAIGWGEGRDCSRSDFPIVYGEAPAGYATLVPARPLRPGGNYRIEGSGLSGYHGTFTIRADLTVDNRRGR